MTDIICIKIFEVDNETDAKAMAERAEFYRTKLQNFQHTIKFTLQLTKSTLNSKYYLDVMMPFSSQGSLEATITQKARSKDFWTP